MKSNVCIISFPIVKAFNTPLSNIVKIYCTICEDVWVIIGCYDDIHISKTNSIHVEKISYKANENFLLKLWYYFFLQIKITQRMLSVRNNVSIIVFFMNQGPYLPMICAKEYIGKKTIWILPSSMLKMNEHKRSIISIHRRFLHPINYHLADNIIVYSNRIIEEWELQKYSKKILVAHRHFLDLEKFHLGPRASQRKMVVGYIGRLSEEKGILNFVEAIPEILKVSSEVKFLIIGDGPCQFRITEFIIQKCLDDKVEMAGWIQHDSLPECYNKIKGALSTCC